MRHVNYAAIGAGIIVPLLLSGCYSISSAELGSVRQQGLPLAISQFRPNAPNSVGGIDIQVNWANASGRVIKYAVFDAVPYNSVGDIEPSTLGGMELRQLRATGPAQPGEDQSSKFQNAFYSHGISCVEVDRIEVTYMDGTVEEYTPPDIGRMMVNGVTNNCKV